MDRPKESLVLVVVPPQHPKDFDRRLTKVPTYEKQEEIIIIAINKDVKMF